MSSTQKTPFYGVPRLTAWLRSEGHAVNRKRVARLMQKMGLAAIHPKPTASARGTPSKTYPYLLKGLNIIRPNQVWATDITYIRLTGGFVYLVAVMDWFSPVCVIVGTVKLTGRILLSIGSR